MVRYTLCNIYGTRSVPWVGSLPSMVSVVPPSSFHPCVARSGCRPHPFRLDCVFVFFFDLPYRLEKKITKSAILFLRSDVLTCRLSRTDRFAQLLRGCCGGVPIFYYLRCNSLKSIIMKIKFGMMITDGRGKLGGQVASKNRSGSYIRTKVTPVNPQTSFQTAVRQRLGMLSSAWGRMVDGQRLNWNEAANSDQWNKSDIFGDSRRPTGKNLFTGINLIRLETEGTMSPRVPRKADFTQFTLDTVGARDDGEVIIAVSFNETPNPDAYLQIEATTAVSPGRYYLKNLYRSVMSTNGLTNGSNVLDISDEYQERFGGLNAANLGARVGFRVRQVIDGQPTPWVALSTIVVTAP